MIYSLIILSCLSIYIIKKSYKTSYGIWLFGVYIGFCISIVGFILYSVYFWDYYYLRTILFNLDKEVCIFIYNIGLSTYTVSRILIFGEALFYYSVLGFGMSYSVEKSYSIKHYLLILILPILLLLLYDPYLGNELFSLFNTYNRDHNTNLDFFKFLDIMKVINRLWFILYTIIAIYNIIKVYKKLNNPFIKNKTLGISISTITLFIHHLLIFYWTPEHLIHIRGNLPSSVHNYSYESYKQLEIYNTSTVTFFYPTIALVSLISFIYALYKYNVFDFLLINRIRRPSTMVHLNQVSSSVSHMVKNRLLEIQYVMNSSQYSMDIKTNMVESICGELNGRLEILNKNNSSVKLEFKKVPIKSIISKTFDRIDPFSTPKIKINLLGEIGEQSSFCDLSYISDVLVNIINNAKEAISDSEGIINITYSTEQMWNIFTIEDSGPGISPDNMKKVFSPFFTTKKSGNNWGIGLSYSQKIVSAHKGQIILENREGGGAIVILLLPVTPQFSRSNSIL